LLSLSLLPLSLPLPLSFSLSLFFSISLFLRSCHFPLGISPFPSIPTQKLLRLFGVGAKKEPIE